MIVLKKYNVNCLGITDNLLVFIPNTYIEKQKMYKFRYNVYLKKHYITPNLDMLDIDIYDKENGVIYINVFSVKLKKILGSVRIITRQNLPILKDCFNFKEPLSIKLFAKHNIAELSRLIIMPYTKNKFLPRHLILIIMIKEVLQILKDKKIFFVYAFIKSKLYFKFKKIKLPFYSIKNYNMKYNDGVLKEYFNQKNDPVLPVYFNYFFVKLFLVLTYVKIKKYINVID